MQTLQQRLAKLIARLGTPLSVYSPPKNGLPPKTRLVRFIVYPLAPDSLETLNLQGTLNLDAGLPFLFLANPDEGVAAADEIAFNGGKWNVQNVTPLPWQGNFILHYVITSRM